MKRILMLALAVVMLAAVSFAEEPNIDDLSMEETFALIQRLYKHAAKLASGSEYFIIYHPKTVKVSEKANIKPGTYILMPADDDVLVYIGSSTYDGGRSIDPYSRDYAEHFITIGESVTVTLNEGQYIETDAGLLLKKVE